MKVDNRALDTATKIIEELRVENKRLRDGLEGIVLYVKNGGGVIGIDREKRIHDTAQQALMQELNVRKD